jgi:predicted RNase H-like nuclease (RuvC/YqgF family)
MTSRLKRFSSRHFAAFFISCALFLGAFTTSSCAEEEQEAEPDPQIQSLQSEVDALQEQLAEKDETISELRDEKAALEDRIPDPILVEEGDSHWKLAYDYLTDEKGVAPEEAERMLAESVLFNPILEGYQVFNYAGDEQYGSFLTQNEAPVPPGVLLRVEKEKMEKEQEELESRVAELNAEMAEKQQELASKIREMEDLKQTAEERRNTLEDHIASLEEHIERLQGQYEEMDSRLHSVYYLAGSKDALETQDKLEDSLFGGPSIGDVRSSDFQKRIDLRKTQVIELDAEELGLSRIGRVVFLPERYTEGRDYRVEISENQRSAKVHLLDEDKFRLETIILGVES